MMKFVRIGLIISCAFSQNIFSINAKRLLQQEAVVKKVKEIEKRVMCERAIAAVTIVSGVICFLSDVTVKESNTSASNVISGTVSLFKNGFENGKYLFFTTNGWIDIARFGFNCVGAIGWSFFTQELLKKFWHPNTMRWYVYTYVPYKATLSGMKTALEKLQDNAITASQKKMYYNSLHVLCAQLNNHTACICAYMLYKGKELILEERLLAQRMSVCFFNFYNDWLVTFIEQIEAQQPDYAQLYEHCIVYEKEIKSACRQFASIEGETIEERRAVEG